MNDVRSGWAAALLAVSALVGCGGANSEGEVEASEDTLTLRRLTPARGVIANQGLLRRPDVRAAMVPRVGAPAPVETAPDAAPGTTPNEDVGGVADGGVTHDSGDCDENAPGQGFKNLLFTPEDVILTAAFEVTPAAPGTDAVVGLSRGLASEFADLAAGVRFNADGVIDVRRGDTYAADRVLGYRVGERYGVEVIANVKTKTYSVLVRDPLTEEVVELAREYPFRTEAQGVEALDNLTHAVDAGAIAVCQVGFQLARGVSFARSGNYAVSPLPSGNVLLTSDDGRAQLLDPSGAVVDTRAVGGQVATDAAGNSYVARTFSGTIDMGGGPVTSAGAEDVVIAKYDSAWRHLSTQRYGGAGNERLEHFGVDATGHVLYSFEQTTASGAVAAHVQRLDPAGDVLWTQPRPEGLLATSSDGGFSAAVADPGAVTVTSFDPSGEAVWSQTFSNPSAELSHVARDAAGNVLLAGTFSGTVNFGGDDLHWRSAELPNGSYIVKLAAGDGGHVYSHQLNMTQLSGVASNGHGEVVVAGVDIVRPVFFHFVKLDPQGQRLTDDTRYNLGLGTDVGQSGAVALGDSGQVFWNVQRERGFHRAPYLVVLEP